MTTAMDVAAYIRAKHGSAIPSSRRLQKLLYFSQAWTLAWTGKPLFDSDFEAWPDGPVEREVWKNQRYYSIPAYSGQLVPAESEAIDAIVAVYWSCTDRELVDLSHEDVWREARGALPPQAAGRSNLKRESIRRHYLSLALRGQGPKRTTAGYAAGTVQTTAVSVIERWREGLDLLATK